MNDVDRRSRLATPVGSETATGCVGLVRSQSGSGPLGVGGGTPGSGGRAESGAHRVVDV